MSGASHVGPARGIRDLRIDPALYPGCVSGTERVPRPGERVHTIEGTARVVRLLGKTGAGGRLLELAMDDGRKPPFFAAAANVLVESAEEARAVEGAGPTL